MDANALSQSTPGDAALVDLIATGDEASFAHVVAMNDPDMVRLAFLLAGDIELARDAAQLTWQRLWTRPPALRDGTKLRSWLLSVVANEARQILRRNRRGKVLEALAASQASEAVASDREAMLDLGAALEKLGSHDRELLGLHYVLGLSSVELSKQLRLTPEGVRSRLRRALERLRRELTDAGS